jgi:PAS domain S-box-containing protein
VKGRPEDKETQALRRKAEKALHTAPEDLSGMKSSDLQSLVHELRVHQLELEMQGEELKDTRRRLEDARSRLNDLFDNAPVGYLVMDKTGKVLEANLKAATMLELERWELVGRPFTDFVESPSQDTFYLHRREIFSARGAGSCEVRLVKNGGEALLATLESIAVTDSAGRYTQMRTTLSDITARRAAEEVARDLIEKLKLVAEESLVGVFILQEGRLVYANRKLAEMGGYTREEMLEMADPLGLIHPGDRGEVQAHVQRMLSGGLENDHMEFRAVKKDGGLVHIEAYGHTTIFRGAPAIAGTLLDITMRKMAMAGVEEGRRILEALMEHIPAGVTIVDAPDGRVRMMSRHALELAGAPEAALDGDSAASCMEKLDIYHSDGMRKVKKQELAAVRAAKGETVTDEGRVIKRPDGKEVPVLVNAGPIKDKEGMTTGGILVWKDMTQARQVELDRTNFYAMISHDIRSPLTAIIGFAELLLMTLKDKVDEETMRTLASILKNSERIHELVDDFLMHSKLQSGTFEPSLKRTDPAQLVQDVRDEFSILARKKGVTLSVEQAEGMPRTQMDRKHMVRALGNLVQNAIKFTPRGGSVNLKAENMPCDGGECIVFSVADTGVGIPPDEQRLVFEKYHRSSNSTHHSKGTGLGLAIAKAIAEAHSGTIELSSEPGKGSTFKIILPLGAGKE